MEDILDLLHFSGKFCNNCVSYFLKIIKNQCLHYEFSVGRGNVFGQGTFLNKSFAKKWDISYVGYSSTGHIPVYWRNIVGQVIDWNGQTCLGVKK